MKRGLGIKRGSRNIWLLGWSSFFNDAGSEIIAPILPFYISALGGGGVAIGLLSGLREGLGSIVNLLGGWLSDRLSRRKELIIFGYFTSFLFRLFMSFANSWQLLMAFVSFERFGKMRDAPRDVIISVSTKQKGRGFAIQQMMDTSGAILGTIIVLLLFWQLGFRFKTIILIAAGISIFSLLPLFFVKDIRLEKKKKTLLKGIGGLDKKLKYLLFVVSVFTLGNFGLYMFLLIMTRNLTGSIIFSLFLYLLFNFVYASFTIPFGKLSDRIGRKKVLEIGYFLFFIIVLSFVYLESNLIYLASLFALYGMVYAITKSNQRAFVADLAGEMKGTALGTYYFIVGIISIIGGLIAGVFWNINPVLMFQYIAVLGLISFILLLFVKENHDSSSSKSGLT
jgi:MFS family permease